MAHETKCTILFDTQKCTQVSQSGGKGASLARLSRAGFPVPPGFVISANAFDEFVHRNELGAEVEVILKRVKHEDINSVDRASHEIQAMILGAQIAEWLREETIRSYRKLHARFVAVRSSATAEDSKTASWAGELETYLNVTEKDLMVSVKKCWASLFTPRAIFYRFERYADKRGSSRLRKTRRHADTEKTDSTSISVAVVVQEMIESEVSGVCFTVHPVTKDRNQMVIEAVWGLGEALVSGQITPDAYVVHKDDGAILDINISEQEFAITRGGRGNTEKILIPSQGGKQKLTDRQIEKLAQLCRKIERHYRRPQDIEWAYVQGKFYILQSRPITTL